MFLAGLLLVLPLAAQAESGVSEDEIKAAFLFNFVKFVDWPPRHNSTSVFVLGVRGRDSFAAALEQIVQGKTINGKPLLVRRLSNPQESRACQVVFLAADDKNRAKQFFAALPAEGILTVGEADDFAERGGVIGFVKEANRVRFEINLEAASRAGLRISSRLLQLARVVHTSAPL
jgi:hypothetical protein